MRKLKNSLQSAESMLSEEINQSTKDLLQRKKDEKIKIDKLEHEDVDFTVSMGKEYISFMFCLFLLIMLPMFKIVGKSILKKILGYEESLSLTHFEVIIITFVILFIIVSFSLLIFMLKCAKPRIRNSYIVYKGKYIHYREITLIKVSSLNVAKIYVNGKKCFTITGDFNNYWSFLSWAEKCNVPMIKKERKEIDLGDFNSDKVNKVYIIILILVIVFFIVCMLYITYA